MTESEKDHFGERRPGRGRAVVTVLVILLAGAAALVWALTRPPARDRHAANATTAAPATQPDTAPSTRAATRPGAKPRGPTTQYLDAILANYPRMPQTRPMEVPLDLSQAARLIFSEPVYLSPGRQDLWITRADAPATETVLVRAAKEQGDQLALAVREHVVFVHWMPRETGPWTFNLIARKRDGSGYELVTQSGRKPIGTAGRNYHWHRALDWNDKVVAATDTGVSVFQFGTDVAELHHELAPRPQGGSAPAGLSEPQFLLDWQGLLAWMPWERGKAGGRGAARFVDGKWEPLGPEQGWPEKLLHLVPLFDGSVLQIVARDADQVAVALASLEKLEVDEKEVIKQVEALADPDDNIRQNAYRELTRYGPSLAPVLERLMKDQEPEAQVRLRQLIKTQVEPTLGGMTLLGDQLRVAARLADGGAVFYAEAGVMMPGEGDTPVLRTPAWLSLRPGQAVELLDPPFTTDLNPDRSRVYAFASEWIVTNDVRGPQRFVGNGFVPLLRKSEVAHGFSEPVGIDRRGRWLFRKGRDSEPLAAGPASPPTPATTPSTAPATRSETPPASGPIAGPVGGASTAASRPAGGGADGGGANGGGPDATLVIDPTLPDPTPRLPVWVYTTATTVGWDKDDWPVVKNQGAWALAEDRWRPLRSKDTVLTQVEEAKASPPPGQGAVTDAKGAAGTVPSSRPADDLGPPLLVAADGTTYHDGRSNLRAVWPDGKRVDWPLPPAAIGAGLSGKVYLVRSGDGLLFLFNQPGRVVRIRPTPDGEEPFAVDATFTRNIPNADALTRVWLDPAGRMVVAYGSRLAIMFPGGYIPTAIGKLMPPGATELEEP